MQFEKREMKMRRAGKAGRAAVFCLCAGLVLGDPVKGFAWEEIRKEYPVPNAFAVYKKYLDQRYGGEEE